jgi:hypothetical protein
MLEVTKYAPQMAIIHLGQAFKNYWAGIAEYPTFKTKGRHDSFTLGNDQLAIKDRKVLFRSSAGCACTSPCGLPGRSWAGPSRVPPTGGS